jgi:hypothetical protein
VRVSGDEHSGTESSTSGQGKSDEDGSSLHEGQNSFGSDKKQSCGRLKMAKERVKKGDLA